MASIGILRVVVLLGVAVPEITAQSVLRQWSVGGNEWAVTLGDLDADGLLDLGIWSSAGPLRFVSTGTAAVLFQVAVAPPYTASVRLWRLGDVDGDGRDDVLHVLSSANGHDALVLSGQNGAVLRSHFGSTFFYPQLQAADVGDLNGDGRDEYLLGNSNATVAGLANAGRVELVDGASGSVLRTHVGTVANEMRGNVTALGDLDADGKIDYVVHGPSAIGAPLTVIHSGASGGALSIIDSWYENVRGVGDVNADGRDDFMYMTPTHYHGASQLTVWLMSGSGGTLWWYTTLLGSFGYGGIGQLADIDNDGHADLTVGGGGQGIQQTVVAGRDRSVLFQMPWGQWLAGSPGDVNGDGFLDHFVGSAGTFQVRSGLPPGVGSIGSACADASGDRAAIGIGVGGRLGHTMTVNLSNADPGLDVAMLVWGGSDQQWNGVALPVSLAAIGQPGCSWYVAPDQFAVLPTVGLQGTRRHATLPVVVPGTPQLLGASLFWQWMLFDADATGITASTTRAVRTTAVP